MNPLINVVNMMRMGVSRIGPTAIKVAQPRNPLNIFKRYKHIDISDLPKEAVVAALYNASRPLGRGYLHYDPKDMTAEEAKGVLATQGPDIDYLKGRVIKVNVAGKTVEDSLYDRDNGPGAAEAAIKNLRGTGKTPPASRVASVTAEVHVAAFGKGKV